MVGSFAGMMVSGASSNPDSWTFIVYMSADTPGSPLNWSADINEMEKGLASSSIEILVLVDPDGIGDSRVYHIVNDPSGSDAIVSPILTYPNFNASGEVDMGDPNTLVQFAEFALYHYYAGGKIGITLWGHGDSWKGVCLDRGDYLTPKELSSALASIKAYAGKPIDLISFDACSMGSVEVLSEISSSVLFSVSSEIPVPATGFPYDSIFARLSVQPEIAGEGAGEVFADEYVKHGALMANTTSQAAVINLSALALEKDSLIRYANDSLTFVPVAKETFGSARNESYETDGISTVDLQTYLRELISNNSLPRRIGGATSELSLISAELVEFNRAFIVPNDVNSTSQSDLNGFTIFMPISASNLSDYGNASSVSKKWEPFLGALMSNATFKPPLSNATVKMEDLKNDDGLVDAFSIGWNATPEVTSWGFDVLPHDRYQAVQSQNRLDDASTRSVDFTTLPPGVYDACAYGFASNGSCIYYRIFEDLTIMKRYQFTVSFSEAIADSHSSIMATDLRTGNVTFFNVNGSESILRFDVPGQFEEGDSILLQLQRDNSTVAWGLIELKGSGGPIELTGQPQTSMMIAFVTILLVSALVGFAATRLLRIGRRK